MGFANKVLLQVTSQMNEFLEQTVVECLSQNYFLYDDDKTIKDKRNLTREKLQTFSLYFCSTSNQQLKYDTTLSPYYLKILTLNCRFANRKYVNKFIRGYFFFLFILQIAENSKSSGNIHEPLYIVSFIFIHILCVRFCQLIFISSIR